MKRLLLVLTVLFAVHTSFATTLDAVALGASFTLSDGSLGFHLRGAGADEVFGINTNFTGVDVLSLTCGNATCTRFNSDIVLSGFEPIGVTFKRVGYNNVSLLGSLDFTSTRLSVAVNGTLIACLDPTCSSGELFTLDVHTHGSPRIVVTDTNGNLSLVSARDVVPEPSSLALFGTGFIFLVGVVRQRRLLLRVP